MKPRPPPLPLGKPTPPPAPPSSFPARASERLRGRAPSPTPSTPGDGVDLPLLDLYVYTPSSPSGRSSFHHSTHSSSTATPTEAARPGSAHSRASSEFHTPLSAFPPPTPTHSHPPTSYRLSSSSSSSSSFSFASSPTPISPPRTSSLAFSPSSSTSPDSRRAGSPALSIRSSGGVHKRSVSGASRRSSARRRPGSSEGVDGPAGAWLARRRSSGRSVHTPQTPEHDLGVEELERQLSALREGIDTNLRLRPISTYSAASASSPTSASRPPTPPPKSPPPPALSRSATPPRKRLSRSGSSKSAGPARGVVNLTVGPPPGHHALPLDPAALWERLRAQEGLDGEHEDKPPSTHNLQNHNSQPTPHPQSQPPRLLVLDLRRSPSPPLPHATPLSLPSLIVKRMRRAAPSLAGLEGFITSPEARARWPASLQTYDVVVTDERMEDTSSDAWALLGALGRQHSGGAQAPQGVFYLKGGAEAALRHPDVERWREERDRPVTPPLVPPSRTGGASPKRPQLGRINTSEEVLRAGAGASAPRTAPLRLNLPGPPAPKRGLTLTLPGAANGPANEKRRPSPLFQTSFNTHNSNIEDEPRTPLAPGFSSASSPPSASSAPTPVQTSFNISTSPSPTRTTSTSPSTLTSATEAEALRTFDPTPILPGFLFLGPEPASDADVRELQRLGVRRIINMARECDDDLGLRLRERFERYERIPMVDSVQERNVQEGMSAVCDLLDDARLHSRPTYVHCKAGKSRSVTVVLAYLIRANRWPLRRAYAFVTDRRKGVSPNLAFIAELMQFERDLGVGAAGGASAFLASSSPSPPAPPASAPPDNSAAAAPDDGSKSTSSRSSSISSSSTSTAPAAAAAARRNPHFRESLPPKLNHSAHSAWATPTPADLEGGSEDREETAVADQGSETEVKDRSGRYVHARRAPLDERLQPTRRVSKAGLESGLAFSSWGGNGKGGG